MRRMITIFLIWLAVLGMATPRGEASAQDPQVNEPAWTPPRISYLDGEVSFWRSGAPDWSRAVVNTPLASGDELTAGSRGTLELQVGPRSFIRAWGNTQLGLLSQEPAFLQFKITNGHASFDLRALDPGETVEVDTPNAAITIEHPGYYRVEIAGERTAIITRRAGRATVTPASGGSIEVLASEELVVEGSGAPQTASYAAPPMDDWDRWNYARTNSLLEAVSFRYVPPGIYGVDDLDHYGTWRVVPEYGPVWIPSGVPADWVPYSTGSWIMDPYYGWTWVSSLPWGWVPFHYGRWVRLDRYWAWAPGPVIVRPVYAPALVAFLGAPSSGVAVGVGRPLVGWVALGWGEPCIPWWGSAGFAHRPWWGGWGGPRVVNNVVINQTTVVNVQNITVYRNMIVPNAVVVVQEERFGRGPVTRARVPQKDFRALHPLHTGPAVQPKAASWVPTSTRGMRPSDDLVHRPIVATHTPRPASAPSVASASRPAPAATPAIRIVSVTRPQPAAPLMRPSFGKSPGERGMSDRGIPPRPPQQPQVKKPDQGGSTAASIRNAPPSTPQGSPATGPAAKGGEPRDRKPVPPVVTQKAPQAVTKAPAAATPATSTPAPQVGSPAGSASVRSAPSRPAPAQVPAAGPSLHGTAAPSSGSPPASQAAPKRYGAAPPLPGEPANRIAPHRVEAPRARTPKPAADQRIKEP
jgi:hypothetical protein